MSSRSRRRSTSRRQSSAEVSSSSEFEVNTDANFYPTVFGLVAFGLLNIAVSSLGLPKYAVAAILLVSGIFALQFFHIYGHHFSRAVHVFYDEANILATNEAFECYDGAVDDDATPGGCCGSYPIMGPQDSFYVQHYGNMMPNAKRFEAEWREADRKRLEQKRKEEKKSA